jgi:hypothetical protein
MVEGLNPSFLNNSLSLPPPRAHIRELCGMSDEPLKTEQLLAQATAGDEAAWGSLLTAEQERLISMVAFRMDPRLRGRIDAADVVQEAFVQASAHREDFLRAPECHYFSGFGK